MIKSMTGFGRCETAENNRKFTVEMKSVNHRYCDITIKMPKKLSFFESAIRSLLKKYIQRKNKRRDGGSLREKIYIRDGFTCQYCSVTVGDIHPLTKKRLDRKDLTLDHINPKSKGGENTPFNLVTACKPCNNRKADRTPEMARMPLLTKELAINGLDKFLICHYAESRPEWIPYLETQEGFKQILEKKNLLEVV